MIGISNSIGFLAYRVPIVTLVSHFSRYPSNGYLEIDAPRNNKSSKVGSFLLAPPPLISYMPVAAARRISLFTSFENVAEYLGVVCGIFVFPTLFILPILNMNLNYQY